MDKKYIELFQGLAQAMAATAETVMEYNHSKDDTQGEKTAEVMRTDYQNLSNKIKEAGENYSLSKPDCAKMIVAAMVVSNQLQDKIASLKKALTGYQTDLLPKLQELFDNTSEDEWDKKADEIFIIQQ